MMEEKTGVEVDTGGPAFPLPAYEDWDGSQVIGQDGMTLRDYFAAKAMQGSIGAGNDNVMRGYEGWRDELAREAYRYADAMLAARSAA
jgi:hypothetical protein